MHPWPPEKQASRLLASVRALQDKHTQKGARISIARSRVAEEGAFGGDWGLGAPEDPSTLTRSGLQGWRCRRTALPLWGRRRGSELFPCPRVAPGK